MSPGLLAICLACFSGCVAVRVIETSPNLVRQEKIPFLGSSQKVPASVEWYAGLVHTNNQDMFVSFVRSADTSSSKPLVVWYNGGPGCSSMAGFLMGVGPFLLKPCDRKRVYACSPKLILNENSWHQHANILFIDTPPGTGFSPSKKLSSSRVDLGGTALQAVDHETLGHFNAKVLKSSIDLVKEELGLVFDSIYLSGESFAGIYVSEMLPVLLTDKVIGPKLKGVLLGNPMLGTRDRIDSVAALARRCVVPKCQMDKLIRACSSDVMLSGQVDLSSKVPNACTVAYTNLYRRAGLITKPALGGTGASWYNTQVMCDQCAGVDDRLHDCSPECFDTSQYEVVFNKPWFKKQLFKGSSEITWKFCTDVGKLVKDFPKVPTPKLILNPDAYLPEHFRFWIYSGDTDLELTYESSALTMARAFGQAMKRSPWEHGDFLHFGKNVDAKLVRVTNGGHLVTLYKNAESSDLLRRFLAGDVPSGELPMEFTTPVALPRQTLASTPFTNFSSFDLTGVESVCAFRQFKECITR